MYILPAEDIAGALSWLTTDVFGHLGLPAMAVVLAGPGHGDLLRHLEEQCRDIDRESRDILILSLGTGRDAPELFNPPWRFATGDELAYRIDAIRSRLAGRRYRPGTSWGTFTEAALRLLDLELSCLPALYLRFASTGSGDEPGHAVVVPLPHARPELASRFLKKLSWEASDHASGIRDLGDFLRENELSGLVISEATQEALDVALSPYARILPTSGSHEGVGEIERVRMVLESALATGPLMSWGHSDIVFAADRYFAPRGATSPTAFRRPDLAIGLRLAAVGDKMGDRGTTVRNIAAALESLFAASLVHLVRGAWNVRLPAHLDHVDPEAGPVEVAGVSLNHPRKDAIGADGGQHPWLAPPLAAGMQAFERWLSERAPATIDRSSCAGIVALLGEIAGLRNPPAHGEFANCERAQRAWTLLENFILSGQAAAMAAIRDGFHAWPHIDWAVFASIRTNARPRYERALRDNRDAAEALREAEQARQPLLDRITALRAAITELSKSVEAAEPNLQSLANLPSVTRMSSLLDGWDDVRARLAAACESDRQAKSLARSAARWFTTRSAADRCSLAEVSRQLTPTPESIRNAADIDGVISRIEAILAAGIVVPISDADWRAHLRSRLERWLESLDERNAATGHLSADAARERARAWIADLESAVNGVEPAFSNADRRVAEARVVHACATDRLDAARVGTDCPCRCAKHESKSA